MNARAIRPRYTAMIELCSNPGDGVVIQTCVSAAAGACDVEL